MVTIECCHSNKSRCRFSWAKVLVGHLLSLSQLHFFLIHSIRVQLEHQGLKMASWLSARQSTGRHKNINDKWNNISRLLCQTTPILKHLWLILLIHIVSGKANSMTILIIFSYQCKQRQRSCKTIEVISSLYETRLSACLLSQRPR